MTYKGHPLRVRTVLL